MKIYIKIFLLISLIGLSSCWSHKNEFIISGQVTDFNNNPIDSVSIHLKDRNFRNLYSTLTDKNGKTKLEYWTWNVPVYKNLEINPQYDKIEIYGINVFEPQVTPQNTYIIYFRPMSLSKSLKIELKP